MTDFKPLFLTSFFCVAQLSFFVTFVGAKLLYDYFVRSIQNVSENATVVDSPRLIAEIP